MNLPNRLTGRPKRELVPFGHVLQVDAVSTRNVGHGVEYRPKVTENGQTKRSNPSKALSALQEQATRPDASVGRMAQEANAFGKAEGDADVGRVYGKPSAMEGCRSYGTRRGWVLPV